MKIIKAISGITKELEELGLLKSRVYRVGFFNPIGYSLTGKRFRSKFAPDNQPPSGNPIAKKA
jgi:hypothetical protein